MGNFSTSIADEVRKMTFDDVIRANYNSNGEIFWVVEDSDTDYNVMLQRYSKNVFTTLANAVSAMVTNRNDICFVSANTTHTLSAMLDISKNRCHFIGLGVMGRRYGLRAKMNMGVTTDTDDVFAIKNTGVGNSFVNLKFMSDNTLTQNVGTFGEGGEYALFQGCEFYNSAKLNSDTHAELILNGDSAQFFDCTFGSLADAVSGDKVRPAVLLTKATVAAGKVSRDVLFDRCRFWKQAGGTTTAMVKGGATDVERVMEFHDCQFVASVLGSQPAVAIDVATLTVGQIILTGDTCAFECTKIGTATGIISGLTVKTATTTIGIQAT